VLAAITYATGDLGRLYALTLKGGRPDLAWKAKIALISFTVYCVLNAYPLSRSGQSWGKRMLGLKIVDLQGRQPGLLRLLGLRYGLGRLIGLVPVLGYWFALVDDCFIFREDRRCVHDFIAGTRVVVAASSPDG
jgi:uncharacterized RDD family membrane protein YckC